MSLIIVLNQSLTAVWLKLCMLALNSASDLLLFGFSNNLTFQLEIALRLRGLTL